MGLKIAKNVYVTKNFEKNLQITYSRTTSLKHHFITDIAETGKHYRLQFSNKILTIFPMKRFINPLIHSFYFAFNKKYNNSIQKYIKNNIQYSN